MRQRQQFIDRSAKPDDLDRLASLARGEPLVMPVENVAGLQ